MGRGGKRGTYSGRGIKGQRARAGSRIRPALRDLIKRIPKLRGVKFRERRGARARVVNLSVIEKKFENGETVSPKILWEKKIIRKIKGKIPPVKLLGSGEITRKLLVKDCQTSKSAREKIEKAGGSISPQALKRRG